MKFTLRIDMRNEAFGGNEEAEVARILQALVAELVGQEIDFRMLSKTSRGKPANFSLRDSNGNTVGAWNIQP